jgi:hypothetical protein
MGWSNYKHNIQTFGGATPGDSAAEINGNFQAIADNFDGVPQVHGSWSSSTAYSVGDIVLFSDNYYLAITPSTDLDPTHQGGWMPLVGDVMTANGPNYNGLDMSGTSITDVSGIGFTSGGEISDDGTGGINIYCNINGEPYPPAAPVPALSAILNYTGSDAGGNSITNLGEIGFADGSSMSTASGGGGFGGSTLAFNSGAAINDDGGGGIYVSTPGNIYGPSFYVDTYGNLYTPGTINGQPYPPAMGIPSLPAILSENGTDAGGYPITDLMSISLSNGCNFYDDLNGGVTVQDSFGNGYDFNNGLNTNGQSIIAGSITANAGAYSNDVEQTGSITAAGGFYGSGANLTSLPASQLTGSLPVLNGAALTNLNAAHLTGSLSQSSLVGNVATSLRNIGYTSESNMIATSMGTATSNALMRVSWSARIKTAATSSSTLGPLTITYTDGNENASTTYTSSISSAANIAGTVISGVYVVYVKSGAGISSSFAYASSGATAMVYDFNYYTEQLN